MDIYKEEFDSAVLNKRVYKLYLAKTFKDKKMLQKVISKYPIDILFCFTVFSNENIELLENLDFNFVSIRNTYEYPSLSKNPGTVKLNNRFKILNKAQFLKSKRAPNINGFASILLKTSRYYKDKNIDKNSGLKIYSSWIKNSIYNNYAEECIFILDNNKAAGFITLKVKESIGSIDLIAMAEGYRNLGLGTVLMNKAIRYFTSKNVKKIMVITEGENIAANSFYQKNKFTIKNVELVYHKHYGKKNK